MNKWNKPTTPGEETDQNTRIRNINPKTINQNNRNIAKFDEWARSKVENKPDILRCSVGDLFVDINYITFDEKEELMEEILSSREKRHRCKDIVYGILHTKQCNSNARQI